MSVQGIARRYAVALADVVSAAPDKNLAVSTRDELAQWSRMMGDNKSLRDVFRTPTVPYEQKQNLLETLLSRAGVQPVVGNFLRVLLRNQRLGDIEDINQAFANELNVKAGIVSAQITTAHQVTPDVQESLRARLTSMTGRQVQLDFAVDQDLIGGVVTRIGSTIYDGSVRSQLERIREQLTEDQG